MSSRYFIETYGCQMNKAESAAMERILRERGWSAAESGQEADLVLINTCSVRATAETRALGRIDHYAALKRQRNFFLVVTGCMAERLRAELKRKKPAIDYVVGNFQKSAFGLLIDAAAKGQLLSSLEESPAFVFAPSHAEPGSFRSYLPIMHGCDNFCSYCIVPYVRGREVSREPRAILSEIREIDRAGVRELTLLGQNVNSYSWAGPGGRLDFAGLLALVRDEVDALNREGGEGRGIRWLRFMSSHPKDLSDATLEAMASSDLFCRHVHLCVQHGSDRVLQAMNRKYTAGDYLALVDKVRKALPGVSLSTDILMGFPGETEEDVELTLELMRTVDFEFAYMYYFNPREGTPAAAMEGQVPLELRKERLARVIELQLAASRRIMATRVGGVADVLVESVSKRSRVEALGRTQADEMVVFADEAVKPGSFARVELSSLRGNTFKGRRIE
jgi:tRNA-2-methylthio-N6-dimethylallyladenosine synthase